MRIVPLSVDAREDLRFTAPLSPVAELPLLKTIEPPLERDEDFPADIEISLELLWA
jgi:hypothetical protein